MQVIIDDKSQTYLDNFEDRNDDPDRDNKRQYRLTQSRGMLQTVVNELRDPSKRVLSDATPTPAPESKSSETPNPDGADATPQPEIVTIPLSADDELSDIPADMREMVAKEIAAFRERSNRRDMERLKREEEIERMERERNHPPRFSRIASLATSPPPTSAPTGPSGGANAIPIGPSRFRDHNTTPSISRPPTGPASSTLPRDYQKGVSFVNGSGLNGYAFSREEEESDADDDELEARRKAKKASELEKMYLDHERRWLNRERARTSALEREQNRDEEDRRRETAERDAMAKRLESWDDDVETERRVEEYYVDRSLWTRNRTAFRTREAEIDERDRLSEARQAEADGARKVAAETEADSFLARQAQELDEAAKIRESPKEPARFKLSLGAAASKKNAEKEPRRKTAADVENLLEDEEEEDAGKKRVLIPIQYDASAAMDDETRERMVRQLAQEIPTDRKGLFEWNVLWDQVDESIVTEKLKPFVEKKIVEVRPVFPAVCDFVLLLMLATVPGCTGTGAHQLRA